MKTDERILELLEIEGKLSLKQIAEKLNVKQSTISMATQKLASENEISLNKVRIEKSFVTFAFLNRTAEPKSEIQADPPGPAAIEPQEPEPQKPQIQEAKPIKPKKITDETSRKLNLNEILLKMQKMKPEDFPAYRNTLKQLHEHKKKIFIEEMVNFLNAEIL